ncbi:lysoplasmalogenase [Leptospira noguchii]|uniref:YhhN-like protein n=2 Tax=Leptospira noguchii TaxID=28182 RepID=T0FQL1_9LEPT|nr:lysoplasmalogenase [Leptospira noguchii]EMO52458.1 YhhN-like protein [Leptospira noguchii]EQA71875.1 YhhN-like protein [Leptospira noguchii serovar Panama str. CZ214]MCH1913960.1 lysoplasmalogenase [Leptospira noguchii]MCH1917720.1 lysoplasmalogenase [Leptospira noguchii]UOG65779.1 lysoplasmalogenase [Leptospira noguchii]
MILILFCTASVVHLLVLYFVPDNVTLKIGSKIAPILVLIFFSFLEGNWKRKGGKFIFVGLIFSLFGDAFLSVPGNYFVFGLGSFLIAQILYSIGFSVGNPIHIVRAIPYFVFGISFYLWIFSGIGTSLYIPVGVYVTAICVMGWRSVSRECSKSELWKSLAGSLLFILSDSLIATRKFTTIPIPWIGVWIMSTYYAAQFLIYESVEEN